MALAIDERRHIGGLSLGNSGNSTAVPMELGNVSYK